MTDFAEDRSVLTRFASPPDTAIRYGELAEHVADVRFGTSVSAQRPLVIMIHGGFWRPQFDRTHAGPMCVAIAKAGWTIASIEYRRVPGNPDLTTEDVRLAISRLPALVKQHNDTAIVAGHSAGGHLALWAAVKSTSTQLIGALALDPVADLNFADTNGVGDHATRAFLGGSPLDREDLDPCQMQSPSIRVTIVHGMQDSIAPLAMSENYLSRHPKTRLIKVKDCGHFAVIDPLSTAWPKVLDELQLLSQG